MSSENDISYNELQTYNMRICVGSVKYLIAREWRGPYMQLGNRLQRSVFNICTCMWQVTKLMECIRGYIHSVNCMDAIASSSIVKKFYDKQ